MIDPSKHICVYADWEELKAPARMGCLHSQLTHGKEIFSFEFDSEWMKTRSALTLDPDLQMYSGRQYADFDLALSIAPQFRFDMAQAKGQVTTIRETVSHWREIALRQKLARMEIETMASAFRCSD